MKSCTLFRRKFSVVGSANLDWPQLGFGIQQVTGHMEYNWNENTGWDAGKFETNPMMNLHVCGNVLHYGQTLFEGLKAYHQADGKVRVFRDVENWKRMRRGSRRIVLPEVPQDLFQGAIDLAVRQNAKFIPPYGSGGSVYIRPVLFGSTPQMGLAPAKDAKFLVIVTPVSSYYSGGIQGVDCKVAEEFDRAASYGVGHVKAGGNYAADMFVQKSFKADGFPIGLYLDPVKRKYIEEFNTSNFVGIKNGIYVTPNSASILTSITNMSLMEIAEDIGLRVEKRRIEYSKEIDTFEEVGAVGTAVVITPISSCTYRGHKVSFNPKCETLMKIYKKTLAIQFGEERDEHNWMREIKV